MIPVLIAPIINRFDLLERMLLSVDEPVGRCLIVDNAMSGYRLPWDGGNANVTYAQPPYTGFGYGGAINLGIMQNPDAPWWMWASNDVEFHPGHLASVARRMDEAMGPRIVTGGFTWGAVNRDLVDAVGLVDEWSFFPIYFDDNDYAYRCKLAGVEWIEDWAQGSTHGDTQHGASLTIRSDAAAEVANNRSFRENAVAYLDKWGGPPGAERFTSPWDSGMPIWVTRPDMSGRRARQW